MSIFRFKQFEIDQSSSAMKVGTDGVLLGAWFSCDDSLGATILDVGSGTGLISLMAAQRFPQAVIDALEIDPASARQSEQNFGKSDWNARLSLHEISIQEYAQVATKRYDAIVSNPPYFSDSLLSPSLARTMARHDNLLTIEELMSASARLLKSDGVVSLILPTSQFDRAVVAARSVGLNVVRQCSVYSSTVSDSPKRTMGEFSFCDSAEPQTQELRIELIQRHDYSPEYKSLTADFYLKF